MDLDSKKILKTLNPRKVWIPIVLGLGIVLYLFFSDPNISGDQLSLVFEAKAIPIFIAFLVFLFRFAGYIYRIKVITDHAVSWVASMYIIVLWEFASAITPSVVGGTAVAVFILWKEKIPLGKALSYVMLTAIFDNLFFVIAAPVSLLLGINAIFPTTLTEGHFLENGLFYLFVISYVLIATYTFLMAFALFVNPRWIKWLLIRVTSVKWLRRWRHDAYERGAELMIASEQIKGNSKSYWIKITLATIFVWSSRYLMLNSLIAAFTPVTLYQHVVIFGKQIILWIIMLISPTPGSSGTAEYFFPFFFSDILHQFTLIVNLLWRIFTYYPYLLLGAIFLPKWLKRVFFDQSKS